MQESLVLRKTDFSAKVIFRRNVTVASAPGRNAYVLMDFVNTRAQNIFWDNNPVIALPLILGEI